MPDTSDLKRILLVEDNPNDAELALAAFEQANLANEVVLARDGAEALDYLFRRGVFVDRLPGNPAVVLLDLKMPKLDGIDVLGAIRAEPLLKTLPVVMLTSSREEPDLKRCYELGVNAYVVKPVNFQDFITVGKTLGIFWALVNEPPPRTP